MARRLKWPGRETWKNKSRQEVINQPPTVFFQFGFVKMIFEAHVIAQNIRCINIDFISRWLDQPNLAALLI